jgi:hypothetical protein
VRFNLVSSNAVIVVTLLHSWAYNARHSRLIQNSVSKAVELCELLRQVCLNATDPCLNLRETLSREIMLEVSDESNPLAGEFAE